MDSIGQHICKATLDKKATVVIGSTYPVNISYPEDKNFDIIDIGLDKRKYSPIRLTMDETIDRYNDQAMEMSSGKVKEVINSVRKALGKPTKFKGTFTPPQQQQDCPTCPPGTTATPAVAPAVAPGSAAMMPQATMESTTSYCRKTQKTKSRIQTGSKESLKD